MASWVWLAMPPVRGACDVGGGELGGGELGGGELGGGELGGGDVGGDEVGDVAGDGLLCAGELGAAHGVDDGTAPLCPAEAPPEGTLELP
jgi:hypothetical protein